MLVFNLCNSVYKIKNLGNFFIFIIKLEVNIYLLFENFIEYNDLDYF